MNHNGNANKMVSDTPRTDASYFKDRIKVLDESNAVSLTYSILDIQKENEALKAHIKRLEEAGDRMDLYASPHDSDKWHEAKEAKP